MKPEMQSGAARPAGLAWMVAALFVCASPVAGAQDANRAGVNEDVEGREAYFWAMRSYPSTDRPYAAMMRARLAAFNGSAFTHSSMPLLGGSWRALGPMGVFDAGAGYFGSGPQLDAGRVTAVSPSPVAGAPLVIGTASGGVWRGTSFGAGWAPLTDTQCSLTTGAIARDPTNPLIIYAATGEYNVGGNGCGVLRSANGGDTWTSSATGLSFPNCSCSVAFGSLLVDPLTGGSATSTIILGGTSLGVMRSTNSGTTWSVVLVGSPGSLVMHPTRAGIIYAGDLDYNTPGHSGVFRSTDFGATWTMLGQGFPGQDGTSVGRVEVALSPADPDKVFALVNDRTNRRLLGLYRWDEVALTWTQLAATGVYTGSQRGDFGAQAEYDLAIAVDPRNAQRIYIAGVRAFRSTDGGASFTPMGMEIHCDWHTIVIDPRNPDILYAGTDGGVFISTDAGDTWTSKNAGLVITQYYPGISVNPLGTRVMGGSQDNGTHLFSGAPFWDGFLSGDGGYTAINYRDPTISYAETQWTDGSGTVFTRHDASGSFSRTTGIDGTDRALFIPPFVMDPVTPTKLYFGTMRLYRTVNEGTSWIPISVDLSKGTGVISTIAVAPSDTLTIYVGTNDGNVQVSHDGGVTFSPIITGLPNKVITRLVVDPSSASHVLVTVSGFGTGHIFESADAGVTWRNISGNLIDAPANSAAFVGAQGNIFVGTDVGVFQTIDDGATWSAGPSGLPNVIVQDLVFSPSSNLLVAGTYGRGMFSYVVGGGAAVLRGDVNADAKIDAFDALLIQQALVASLPGTIPIYPRGDANCNGVIDSGDVELVLRAAVGLQTPGACVGTNR